MMRRTPMKRTAWPRSTTSMQRRTESDQNQPVAPVICAQSAIKKIVKNTAKMAQIGDFSTTPCPKPQAHRCPALLAMARNRPCLLRVPGQCVGGTDTTVACHSNLSIHGKGGRRKADDEYSVWGCFGCHRWLDQISAPKDVKQMAFALAHIDQVLAWRRLAANTVEPATFRRAALWALQHLNAVPLVSEEKQPQALIK